MSLVTNIRSYQGLFEALDTAGLGTLTLANIFQHVLCLQVILFCL